MDPQVNCAQESGRLSTEGEAATLSKEDEFLRHLSQEEKECLSFLIETIDSLEVELEEDDEEGVMKGDSTISDGFYEFLGMVCGTRQTEDTAGPDDAGVCDNVGVIGNVEAITSHPSAQRINNRSMESVPVVDTTPNQTATFEEGKKEKESMKHQGSETMIALGSNVSNQSRETAPDEQSSPRTLTLLPAHAKKFDTILRSGVSVQELRAQVLARLSGSGQKKPSSQVEGLAAQSNSLRLLGRPEQKAARQDALQRLGLLKFTGGLSNSNNSSSSQPLETEGTQQFSSLHNRQEKRIIKKL
ncbi:uncharacterized protein LOC121280298 [Carcharodon carcharias]|uniref:uncharacterized protein LOC121280298 n=1 Tax=Carcharodon carcharias TaxID=13397 RepID=UPI001B7EC4F1|nr:uncharacterized protein LOC121280298 [Carcharodon carcharias]XP_041048081.1 uncharacterized protein LOC121280298 [Carcharodon carcharias]XP_041048082.1 uncharacterized protein LOC121280298 [Carcharodon carcharias]XP_041048083.1 uncharacterized protein LOC121280298 [Carcharodon carcharias]XP_041048084.1 uncharacterized protein LOC121280298 [Carcharodon carcharias]XP_041048085.1 uncharacterized protein LOC121280298 [Carcharodon carcharias]